MMKAIPQAPKQPTATSVRVSPVNESMSMTAQSHANSSSTPTATLTPVPGGLRQSEFQNLERETRNEADATSDTQEVLRSSGQPLDAVTRAFMEPRFGHDFSRVRVHADARAAESAAKLNALAYTVGRDLVFGSGQFAPRTKGGQGLIAHELAHVIQQSRGGQPPAFEEVAPHETAASEAANALVNGSKRITVRGATGLGLARAGDPNAGKAALARHRLSRAVTAFQALEALAKSKNRNISPEDTIRAFDAINAASTAAVESGNVDLIGTANQLKGRFNVLIKGTPAARAAATTPMDPRHARGYAGEQGMGFQHYSSQEGWIFVQGPSGSAGHGVTTSGFDGVAYNAKLDQLELVDNKSLKSPGNVSSATAIDPSRNLLQNINNTIAHVQSTRDLPARIRILDLLRKAQTAIATGNPLPPEVRLVVTSVGGQSSGISQRLRNEGLEYRSGANPQRTRIATDQTRYRIATEDEATKYRIAPNDEHSEAGGSTTPRLRIATDQPRYRIATGGPSESLEEEDLQVGGSAPRQARVPVPQKESDTGTPVQPRPTGKVVTPPSGTHLEEGAGVGPAVGTPAAAKPSVGAKPKATGTRPSVAGGEVHLGPGSGAGTALAGEAITLALRMVINHYLQEHYAKGIADAANVMINNAIQSQGDQYKSIIAASQKEIEVTQADGRQVSLRVTLELDWQDTTDKDPIAGSGLSIGSVLFRAAVEDIQVVHEGDTVKPYSPPKPEGVSGNVGAFVGDYLNMELGRTVRHESFDLPLEGTNKALRRIREIDARMQGASLPQDVSDHLLEERKKLAIENDAIQAERQARLKVEAEKESARKAREKKAEDERKQAKLDAARDRALSPPPTPPQQQQILKPPGSPQTSGGQKADIDRVFGPLQKNQDYEQWGDRADILEARKNELVGFAKRVIKKQHDNTLDQGEYKRFIAERDFWLSQLRMVIQLWEKDKRNEQAGNRLKGLEDWTRNAGHNALLF